MALTWVLVLALTLFNITATSLPCRRLFMQGLDNTELLPYAELSGTYHLITTNPGGFSKYQHDAHLSNFFFYNSTSRALVLGQGLLLAQTTARPLLSNDQYPYREVIIGWHVYQPSTKRYKSVSAGYIRPRCVDADSEFGRCESGGLSFSMELKFETQNGQSINVTQYEQVYGQYTSYRPVYKATVPGGSSTKVYLYYADGSWRLGNDWSTSMFAKVNDTALRPEFISGVWQIHYSGTWNNWNGKLRCIGVDMASSCSEVRCQNGGKCITAGSQNIQCSCPRGYRGPYCEQRVPSCQNFGNWTYNFGGYFYTEDSYEGSLTAWFCGQRSSPEFRYSVCENRYHRPSWSNRPRCQSITTTTQWIGIQPTRYSYPENDRKTDPFEGSYSWLTPLVITCTIVIQIIAPFIIYCGLLCYGFQKEERKQFAKADLNEDKGTAEKYKTQLDELEGRTLKPENTVTISELRRIQKQLDEEVDQVRARRRQRDREQQFVKTVELSRIYSLYYYISFWLSVIYLIIAIGAKLGKYVSLFGIFASLAILSVLLLPIVFLIETCYSAERQYLKNLSSLTYATERIESIRKTQPSVSMTAECYHMELRTRTVYYTDANGNSQSRTETYWEKVVTANIVRPYLFSHWFDYSKTTLTDIRKAGITKIKMELTVQFGDRETSQHFADGYQQFQDENEDRDDYVDFSITKTVPGFEKRLAAYTDADYKPCWISSIWFWLATAFCLGWPYRIMFNRATGKTEYSIVKVIFANSQSTEAQPTNENHTPETPSEDNKENMMNKIKVNIQKTLDQLNAGLSTDEDEMSIKCAATDEHMNVTLQEAHHTPHAASC